jgi:hypothetical protein
LASAENDELREDVQLRCYVLCRTEEDAMRGIMTGNPQSRFGNGVLGSRHVNQSLNRRTSATEEIESTAQRFATSP